VAPNISRFGLINTNSIAPNSDVVVYHEFTGGTGQISQVGQSGSYPITTGNSLLSMGDLTVTLMLTVTNSLGATTTSQFTVYVLPAIQSFFANPTNAPPGTQIALNATFTGGAGPTGEEGMIGTSPIQSNSSLIVSPQSTTTYTLTVTNPRGESVSQNLTVTVNVFVESFTFSGGSSYDLNSQFQIEYDVPNSISNETVRVRNGHNLSGNNPGTVRPNNEIFTVNSTTTTSISGGRRVVMNCTLKQFADPWAFFAYYGAWYLLLTFDFTYAGGTSFYSAEMFLEGNP
jgi:hypothetical protein